MTTAIKIGIIEDLINIRTSLAALFNAEQDMTCTIAVESIEAFFDEIKNRAVPDILLCDIGLPGVNGIDGIKQIKFHYPGIDIAMLTIHQDTNKIFNALCAGASSYLLKSEPFDNIKKVVIDMRNNGSYMSPPIARKVLEYFNPPQKTSFASKLTAREKEVVEWISEGLSNKVIADKLSVSLHTVKFHLRNIYSKLHINSKNELILKTFRKEI